MSEPESHEKNQPQMSDTSDDIETPIDPEQPDTFEFSLDDQADATRPRLDQFLVVSLREMSRARIQKLIDAGHVTVNGETGKASRKLRCGDCISVTVPALEPIELKPENIPLDIVFEDEDMIVVNKPAGMVTHPGAGVTEGTLVNALLYHCRASLSGISGEVRPGIVHRLDKDTTGLIMAAKHDRSHLSLAGQLAEKTASRTYLALVSGVVKDDAFTVDAPIARHPVRRKQMAVVEGGKDAITDFTVVERYANHTLLRASLRTGRTHQIRVHASHRGHSVAGDLVYSKQGERTRKKLGLTGHALHATCLSFIHPTTSKLLEFSAPLPPDFEAALERLNQMS